MFNHPTVDEIVDAIVKELPSLSKEELLAYANSLAGDNIHIAIPRLMAKVIAMSIRRNKSVIEEMLLSHGLIT